MTAAEVIVDFLRSIGFDVRYGAISDAPGLPGIQIDRGVIVVDVRKLVSAGDLLHECGHLAVMSPAQRAVASGRFDAGGAQEMAAIAWSNAAALHLELDPALVFHEYGYGGGGGWLVKAFASGGTIGVPALCWLGLTSHASGGSIVPGSVYPTMIAWVNESDRELT